MSRTRRASLLGGILLVTGISLGGCGTSDEPVVVSRSSLSSNRSEQISQRAVQSQAVQTQHDSRNSDQESGVEKTATEDPENVVKAVADPAAFRAQLDEYMKSFRNEKNWTYGERTPGELAGVWTLNDGSDKQMIFEVDGVPGTYAERFQGRVVNGIYAISEGGKVIAVARGGGISIGSHTRLQENVLVGPSGPNPMVQWRRKPAPR